MQKCGRGTRSTSLQASEVSTKFGGGSLVGGDSAAQGALGQAIKLRPEAQARAGGRGMRGAAQARGEAQVVGDDLARVQRLEVQHDDRVHVQARLGLHHQWDRLHRRLVLRLRALQSQVHLTTCKPC